MKRFADLTEQEVLALAITNEEEDSRIYRSFAERLRGNYAASAKMFDEMADEEVHHRTRLYDLYREKFGEYLPLVRRQDVKGFVRHQPIWLTEQLGWWRTKPFTSCRRTWNTKPRASIARRRRTRATPPCANC